jgi:hypothetical protein
LPFFSTDLCLTSFFLVEKKGEKRRKKSAEYNQAFSNKRAFGLEILHTFRVRCGERFSVLPCRDQRKTFAHVALRDPIFVLAGPVDTS